MTHDLVVISSGDRGSRWECTCGEVGIWVKGIRTAGLDLFCLAEDRAKGAFALHQDKHPRVPEVTFPPVVYDYDRAGVGNRTRPIDIDDNELAIMKASLGIGTNK